MEKINSISLSRMNNGAHYEFISIVLALATADGAVNGYCNKQIEPLRRAKQDEDDVLVLARKSEYTKLIAEQDKIRDTMYMIIANTAKAWSKYPNNDIANSAIRLSSLITTYKIRTDDQYDKQTGLLANLIQELEGAYREDARRIQMEQVVNQMKQANERVRALLIERGNQEDNRETGRVRAARKATDEAYANFVRSVDAHAFMSEGKEFDSFILKLNAQILRYKQQVLKQKASEPAATASDPIALMNENEQTELQNTEA